MTQWRPPNLRYGHVCIKRPRTRVNLFPIKLEGENRSVRILWGIRLLLHAVDRSLSAPKTCYLLNQRRNSYLWSTILDNYFWKTFKQNLFPENNGKCLGWTICRNIWVWAQNVVSSILVCMSLLGCEKKNLFRLCFLKGGIFAEIFLKES